MKLFLKRAVGVAYAALFVWTPVLLCGMRFFPGIHGAKEFAWGNLKLIPVVLFAAGALFFANARWGARAEALLRRYRKPLLFCALALLLVWQLIAGYGGYFQSDWDPRKVRNAAIAVADGSYVLDNTYFSRWPNNTLLVGLFALLARLSAGLGFAGWEYALVAFQCVLNTVSVWLIYRVAKGFGAGERVSFLAFFTGVGLIGLSPWVLVPYSDGVGLLFPVLLLRIFQRIGETERKGTKLRLCFAFGVLAAAGYCIKPQIAIVPIAVLSVAAAELPGRGFGKRLCKLAPKAACAVLGIAVFLGCNKGLITPALRFEPDPELTVGWQHYLMMGLNTETDGGWSATDYEITYDCATKAERDATNLKIARERLKALGPGGLARHLCRKQLVNYADGTFGWGAEDGFFGAEPEWAHNGVSGFVRSAVYPNGARYTAWANVAQGLWFAVLCFQPFVFLTRKRETDGKRERALVAAALSVLGLTLFELLFEARARYLFCFAPLYTALFAVGARNAYHVVAGTARRFWKKQEM